MWREVHTEKGDYLWNVETDETAWFLLRARCQARGGGVRLSLRTHYPSSSRRDVFEIHVGSKLETVLLLCSANRVRTAFALWEKMVVHGLLFDTKRRLVDLTLTRPHPDAVLEQLIKAKVELATEVTASLIRGASSSDSGSTRSCAGVPR